MKKIKLMPMSDATPIWESYDAQWFEETKTVVLGTDDGTADVVLGPFESRDDGFKVAIEYVQNKDRMSG